MGGVGDAGHRRGRDRGGVVAARLEHVVATQPLVGAEQPARCRRHVAQRHLLCIHHVTVEVGGPPDGLARVVDDEVESVAGFDEVMAESLDTRRVAQIETEDLETMAPLREVGLARISPRRVAWETSGDDEMGAGAQQLDACLVSDLHPAAGEQCHPAAQVGCLSSFGEVEVGTWGTHLVVERMDLRVLLLADVAVLRVQRLTFVRFHRNGREHVRSGEHRPGPKRPDAGARQRALISQDLLGLELTALRLDLAPSLLDVGRVHVAGSTQQTRAILERQRGQQRTIGDDRLQQFGGGAHPVAEIFRHVMNVPSVAAPGDPPFPDLGRTLSRAPR
ncbi:MAG: hypothetical protein FD127_938 [Acidimicrobiaceae bacterium]|nr:MAG: hypothetical protein FD127_938 [Acidimicrobiaceae bacterium]